MSRTLQPVVTSGADIDDSAQRGFGLDAEYSAGRFLGRGEVIWSQWTLPAPFLDGPLKAASVHGEARYRLIPGVHVAARAEHLGFSAVTSGLRREKWDGPVTRYEVGAGWAVQRNVIIKASWQRNQRDAGRVRHDSLGAAQLVYWF
jgi:hypothetical protein